MNTSTRHLSSIVVVCGSLCAALAQQTTEERWRQAVRQASEFQNQGQLRKAERELNEALRLVEVFGPEDSKSAVTWNNAASVQQALGQHAAAERLYLRALTACEKGADKSCLVRFAGNLAALYAESGRLAKAEQRVEEVFSRPEGGVGGADLARLYVYLATVSFRRSRFQEAETLCRRSLAVWDQVTPREHEEKASLWNNLAAIRLKTGRPAEAVPLLERAIAMIEATLGAQHVELVRPLGNLAASLAQTGRHGEALLAAERARAISEHALGPDHVETARALEQLAAALRLAGRKREAKDLEKRARAVLELHQRENMTGHTVDYSGALAQGSWR